MKLKQQKWKISVLETNDGVKKQKKNTHTQYRINKRMTEQEQVWILRRFDGVGCLRIREDILSWKGLFEDGWKIMEEWIIVFFFSCWWKVEDYEENNEIVGGKQRELSQLLQLLQLLQGFVVDVFVVIRVGEAVRVAGAGSRAAL